MITRKLPAGDLQVMVFMGTPHRKPFYKLLGYGGALMHKSEELVRALMLEYEKVGVFGPVMQIHSLNL